jgi:tetratricopeptide (TPR) repeat protein
MRVVAFAGTFWLLCAFSAHAQSCATGPKSSHENERRYAKERISGDRAFREGKYEKAVGEYLQAVASTDEAGASEAYFKLGEAYALLGNFDKAYACLAESGPEKIPSNRILVVGIGDEKARRAAQLLLDTIGVNTPRYPYWTYPEYLALAAIVGHEGLMAESQAYEGEARIHREAAEAWDAVIADGGNLAAADRAAIAVYERSHRREPAEILQAQLGSEPPFAKRRKPWWFHLDPNNW